MRISIQHFLSFLLSSELPCGDVEWSGKVFNLINRKVARDKKTEWKSAFRSHLIIIRKKSGNIKSTAECPTIPISSGLSRFCLKIPNPKVTSVGIGKSRFWCPESYFRQINKETKYLTWIWDKVKVWTKKNKNKNPLPSVSDCIAFVQGLLRLVTSHVFRASGKYQAWKQAGNDDQFTEPFLTEIFIWECWKWCFRASRLQKFRGTP